MAKQCNFLEKERNREDLRYRKQLWASSECSFLQEADILDTHSEQLQETATNDTNCPQPDSTRTLCRDQQMFKGPQSVMPAVEC